MYSIKGKIMRSLAENKVKMATTATTVRFLRNFHGNSGCRPRFVNAELDPGGRGKELVGKGLDTVRARLATVRARLVILNKICENLINEIPLKKGHQKIEITFKFT